jgi:hypothetical protein
MSSQFPDYDELSYSQSLDTPSEPSNLPVRLTRKKKKGMLNDDDDTSFPQSSQNNSQTSMIIPNARRKRSFPVSIFDDPEAEGGLQVVHTDNPGANIHPARRLSADHYRPASSTSYAPLEFQKSTTAPSKVARTFRLSRIASARTGYMEGELALRMSSCGELSEQRSHFNLEKIDAKDELEEVIGAPPCSVTVMLDYYEVMKLCNSYPEMMTQMQDPKYENGIFSLSGATGLLRKSVEVGRDIAVVTSFMYGPDAEMHVKGEVRLNKVEFQELGNALDSIKAIFQKFPIALRNDRSAQLILDVSSNMMLHMIEGEYGRPSPQEFDDMPPTLMRAFFKVYNEAQNYNTATAVLSMVRSKMESAGVKTDIDMYTYLHQIWNDIPLLFEGMRANL